MSLTTEPRFLYPRRDKFAFDRVCGQIVHALEERNWDIPGIAVEFANDENSGITERYVASITGDDFKLDFMFESYSSAPVTMLAIPGRRLSVYSDDSGPSYYVYVGNDWQQDRRHFLDDYQFNSKLDGKPRTYLLYKGGCMCEQEQSVHHHTSRVAPLLIHNNDMRREYDLEIGEPSQYQTKAVFQDFSIWLQTLLGTIELHPLPTTKTNPLAQRLIPFPEAIGPIFGFGGLNDARRIYQGKQDPQGPVVSERYGLGGSQFSRLVPTTNPESDEKYSSEYSSFTAYGLGDATPTTLASQLFIPGQYRSLEKSKYVFKVTPTHANGIYVVDNGVYEQTRKDLFTAIAPRDRLTDSELNQAYAAFHSTRVPISEYDGSYTEPVVWIGRGLDLDEVELVSGPWPECQYIDFISHYNDETARLFEELIHTQQVHDRNYNDESAKAALNGILETLGAHFMGDEQFKQTVEKFSAKHQFGPVDTLLFLRVIAYAASEAREVGL